MWQKIVDVLAPGEPSNPSGAEKAAAQSAGSAGTAAAAVQEPTGADGASTCAKPAQGPTRLTLKERVQKVVREIIQGPSSARGSSGSSSSDIAKDLMMLEDAQKYVLSQPLEVRGRQAVKPEASKASSEQKLAAAQVAWAAAYDRAVEALCNGLGDAASVLDDGALKDRVKVTLAEAGTNFLASLDLKAQLFAGVFTAGQLAAGAGIVDIVAALSDDDEADQDPKARRVAGCGTWAMLFQEYDKGNVQGTPVKTFASEHQGVQGLRDCWVLVGGVLHPAEFYLAGAWHFVACLGLAVPPT